MDLSETRQTIERQHTRIAKLSAWFGRHPRLPATYQRERLATRLAILERQMLDLDCVQAATRADHKAAD